ncbi:Uncharacterised protein [Mycobacterium tuberculosis]|nr:Uncharacterised protein [Mycobacterium tuberculosis]
MRRPQRARELPPDHRDAAGRQRPVLVHDVLEGPGAHQLHDDPRAVVLVHDVVHGHDARVVQPRRRAGLAERPAVPVLALVVAQPGGQHHLLDRDLAVEGLVEGAPHGAHAAASDHGFEPVATGEEAAVHQSSAGLKCS